MSDVAPGTIIGGRYRLIAELGRGGMGSVWKAEHLTLRSTVAIKLIDPDISAELDMLERFKNEAQGAASLRSPHVVQVIDYGAEGGAPFIAMELLEGESLAARIVQKGRLSNAETARFVSHVARALVRAHEAGIVHRDLKPDNVFLVPNDDQEIAKVLDFGVAKYTKASSFDNGKGPTRTGLILGTPAYMSPEQAQGIKTLDGRSDLWSLGVIAHECLLGSVPFESKALGDLLIKICVQPIPAPSSRGPVPPGFDAWFAKACCRDIDARFQTAKELADALRAVLVPDAMDLASSLSGSTATPSVQPPSMPVSSGSSMPPPVALAATQVERPAHVTVPGLSLAFQQPPRKPSAPLLVSVALGMLVLGATLTYGFASSRRTDRAPVLAATPPGSTASSLAPPSVAPRDALATEAPPLPSITPAASVSSVPSVSSGAPPATKPRSSPSSVASVSASAHALVGLAGLAGTSKPALPPQAAPPPPASAAPVHSAGDRRLGF